VGADRRTLERLFTAMIAPGTIGLRMWLTNCPRMTYDAAKITPYASWRMSISR